MHTTLNIIILVYITLTFLSFLLLLSSIGKFQGTAKYICIFLSIASGWAVSNNIFWLFFENSFEITKKIPLFSEYTDYIITTPLSLISLSFFAMNKIVKDKTLILVIIVSDVVMMLTGAIAEYYDSIVRQIWFWVGCLPFLVILFIIWQSLRLKAKNQNKTLYKSYLILSAYITFLWSMYPLFWYLGPFGLSFLTITQVGIAYHLTSIFTKAGYYLLFYSQLKLLNTKSSTIQHGGSK